MSEHPITPINELLTLKVETHLNATIDDGNRTVELATEDVARLLLEIRALRATAQNFYDLTNRMRIFRQDMALDMGIVERGRAMHPEDARGMEEGIRRDLVMRTIDSLRGAFEYTEQPIPGTDEQLRRAEILVVMPEGWTDA